MALDSGHLLVDATGHLMRDDDGKLRVHLATADPCCEQGTSECGRCEAGTTPTYWTVTSSGIAICPSCETSHGYKYTHIGGAINASRAVPFSNDVPGCVWATDVFAFLRIDNYENDDCTGDIELTTVKNVYVQVVIDDYHILVCIGEGSFSSYNYFRGEQDREPGDSCWGTLIIGNTQVAGDCGSNRGYGGSVTCVPH